MFPLGSQERGAGAGVCFQGLSTMPLYQLASSKAELQKISTEKGNVTSKCQSL